LFCRSVRANRAVSGGGLHHVGDAPLLVDRSTLSRNVSEHGGGLFVDGDGEATVENSTVSGNRAGQFGGGLLVSSRVTVRSSTIADNNAPSGGGINNGGGPLIGDGFVFLGNSIVANNPTGGNCAGTITSLGGNVENGDTCQLRELSDQPGTNPRLGPLADNGGPTWTHALLAGSPAIDAGDPEFDPLDPPLTADQRGLARVADGTGDGTARIDIGAFEQQDPLTPPSEVEIVVTTFNDLDPDEEGTSLRQAVIQANHLSANVTIFLDAGTYSLTRQGANEDAGFTGDLDIRPNGTVTVIGAGAGQTVIDADALGDRVFHVHEGAMLHLQGVTVTGGSAFTWTGFEESVSGGGILNQGTLTVTASAISGNSAEWGGGIYNLGTLTVTDTLISANSAGEGGGIASSG
jgi:large repetitive protein